MAKVGVGAERTLRELARLCFLDPRKFFHDDGRSTNSTAALAGFDVKEGVTGHGKDRVTVIMKKYRFADKNAALDKAMKHLGLFENDNTQAGNAIAKVFKISAKEHGGHR
jgi:hypothetical protein